MTGLVFSIAVVSASVAGSQSVTSLFSSAAGLNNGVPDLTVTKINGPLNTSSKLKLWSGFCYDVRNAQYRKTVSSGFTSSVYVDGVLDREDIFDQSIPAGRWRTKCLARDFTLDCSVGSTKSYVVKICADSGPIVSEANENNNCLEKTFSCASAYSAAELAPKPDLTIEADGISLICHEGYRCIDVACSYTGTYSIDRVVAKVTNIGEGRANNVLYAYWINGEYAGGSTCIHFFSAAGSKNWATQNASLAPRDENQKENQCHQNPDGTWETKNVKVCVNPSLELMKTVPVVSNNKTQLARFGKVLESNYDNNCLAVSLSCDPKSCCEKGCTPSCCDPAKGL